MARAPRITHGIRSSFPAERQLLGAADRGHVSDAGQAVFLRSNIEFDSELPSLSVRLAHLGVKGAVGSREIAGSITK